jgi:hypothetical protein
MLASVGVFFASVSLSPLDKEMKSRPGQGSIKPGNTDNTDRARAQTANKQQRNSKETAKKQQRNSKETAKKPTHPTGQQKKQPQN